MRHFLEISFLVCSSDLFENQNIQSNAKITTYLFFISKKQKKKKSEKNHHNKQKILDEQIIYKILTFTKNYVKS